MRKNFMNGFFDFNNDGKISSFERAMYHMAIEDMVEEIEAEEAAEAAEQELLDGYDVSNFNEDDDFEDYQLDEMIGELDAVGLDYYELAYMDEYDRDELLLEVGLDPCDFEF